MKTKKRQPRIDIVEAKTRKVVDSIDLHGDGSPRRVEKILRGLLMNMDRDRFFAKTVNCR